MKPFISENFLLETPAAIKLYHDYAKDMPIIDYHNHLVPKEISSNFHFKNITDLWLGYDHYKWRAMRTNGINEELITGSSPKDKKFQAWASTVQKCLRNPLYHWAHLELGRYFHIDDVLLGPDTWEKVYQQCNEMLADKEFCARNLIAKMNVKVLCTTDDPTDSLEFHKEYMADNERAFNMYPAFRPDNALKIEFSDNWNKWIYNLENLCGIEIKDFVSLLEALDNRHQFFHDNGCRISDYGLETIYDNDFTEKEIDGIILKARQGKEITFNEILKFKSGLHYNMLLMDHKRKWTAQLHIGAIRNNNTRYFKRLGPDSGFDSIGDERYALKLSRFMDRLDRTDQLAKTIIYPINPRDFAMIASMTGNFQDGSYPGKIQFGSGWWFMDQKDGIEAQLNALSYMGLLWHFIGMTTDSRSLISFVRHEYFRRILANLIGKEIEKGLIPDDIKTAGLMIQDICYHNSCNYFGLGNA